MFFQQLDWFSMADRTFFLCAYIVPLTALVVLGGLVVEYKLEMRKRRKNKKRR